MTGGAPGNGRATVAKAAKMEQAISRLIEWIAARGTYTGEHSRETIAARRFENMGIAPEAARKLAF